MVIIELPPFLKQNEATSISYLTIRLHAASNVTAFFSSVVIFYGKKKQKQG